MPRRRRIDPTHPSVVDLTPTTIPVGDDQIECPTRFTYKLGTYVAWVDMPDGSTFIGPAMPTRELAQSGAYWNANFNHLTDNNS